ncbi:hypothetical protein [Vibrio rhizosphaerae]|uniref:hypothetical protein n=1 Tax=Vibrio rhizosphaerae TaxID=398736 RepID=UPI000571FA5C|nr:hypothetical protein [Vibrio rhizosphaerae]
MCNPVIDRIIEDLSNQVRMQHMGGKRKDGRSNRTEISAVNLLGQLKPLLKQKLTLCQQAISKQNLCDLRNSQRQIDSIQSKLLALQLRYETAQQLKQLCNAISRELLCDVLVSQRDGSRFGYLTGLSGGENGGLATRTKQGFSVFSTHNANVIMIPITGIADADRLGVPTDVAQAATALATLVQNNFNTGLDDLNLCGHLNGISQEVYEHTNQVDVYGLVHELGMYDYAMTIMAAYKSLFIPPSGMGHLPPFFIDRQTWEPYHDEQVGLASRSLIVDETGHSHSTRVRINLNELKETLVDFALLVAALDQGKPVYGSCQGAHVGWLLVGGEMVKWNKYIFTNGLTDNDQSQLQELPNQTVINDPQLNPGANTDPQAGKVTKTLDIDSYGSDEKVVLSYGDSELTAETDFAHATVMIHDETRQLLLEGVRVLKMHPLHTVAQDLLLNPLNKANNGSNPVSTIAKDTALRTAATAVEQFSYNTLTGTQSHPFKHIHDENSLKFVSKALGNLGVKLYKLVD